MGKWPKTQWPLFWGLRSHPCSKCQTTQLPGHMGLQRVEVQDTTKFQIKICYLSYPSLLQQCNFFLKTSFQLTYSWAFLLCHGRLFFMSVLSLSNLNLSLSITSTEPLTHLKVSIVSTHCHRTASFCLMSSNPCLAGFLQRTFQDNWPFLVISLKLSLEMLWQNWTILVLSPLWLVKNWNAQSLSRGLAIYI